MGDFQFNAVLVCDDVRKEQNNKEILIGVYGADILVPALPVNLLLSFWMEITSKKNGPYHLTLRVQSPNPEHKIEFQVDGDVVEARAPFTIFTPQLAYPIDREGQLKLYARSPGSEKFELIKIKQVKYTPPTKPPAPAPKIV